MKWEWKVIKMRRNECFDVIRWRDLSMKIILINFYNDLKMNFDLIFPTNKSCKILKERILSWMKIVIISSRWSGWLLKCFKWLFTLCFVDVNDRSDEPIYDLLLNVILSFIKRRSRHLESLFDFQYCNQTSREIDLFDLCDRFDRFDQIFPSHSSHPIMVPMKIWVVSVSVILKLSSEWMNEWMNQKLET
jgi:hypothetical protein